MSDMVELRPNAKRAKVAISLIWVVTAFTVGLIFFDIVQMLGIVDLNVDYIDDEDYITIALNLVFGLVGMGYTIVYIISAVTFIMWFRRAYWNLHQRVDLLSYGDGWAAGGWCVPIMNLYVPYKIMKELFEQTNMLLAQNLRTCSIQLKTNYIGFWWALWIVTNIVSGISSRLEWSFPGNELSLITSLISSVSLVFAAFLINRIIRNYSAIEPILGEMKDDDRYNVSDVQANLDVDQEENISYYQ